MWIEIEGMGSSYWYCIPNGKWEKSSQFKAIEKKSKQYLAKKKVI
jgi:hypothetical protein